MKKNFDCVEMKNRIQREIYELAGGDWKKSGEIIRELASRSQITEALGRKLAAKNQN